MNMQPRKISDVHRANLRASWTTERKRKASEARRGQKRGQYRKDS